MPDLIRITIDPDIGHGKPCVHHMRWPLEVLPDMVASGMGIDEIVAVDSEREREDIAACLQYARVTVSGEAARPVA